MPLSKLEASVEINRPIEEVVAFIDDNRNDPIWQTSVLESEQKNESEPAVGRFFKVASPVVGHIARRELEMDFANLKELLEAKT